MNLDTVIRNAYIYNKKVGRDKIFISVDIHDTIAQANYADEMPEVIETAMDALRKLNKFPEIVLILFSSSYNHEQYISYFIHHGVRFKYFNENPEVCDTKTGDFSKKFFYNVLIDDKAGFELSDWDVVVDSITKHRSVFETQDPEGNEEDPYVLGYQFTVTSSKGDIQYGPYLDKERAINRRDELIKENLRLHIRFQEYDRLMRDKEAKLKFAFFGNSHQLRIEMDKWKEFLLDSRPEFKEMHSENYHFGGIKTVKIYT